MIEKTLRLDSLVRLLNGCNVSMIWTKWTCDGQTDGTFSTWIEVLVFLRIVLVATISYTFGCGLLRMRSYVIEVGMQSGTR